MPRSNDDIELAPYWEFTGRGLLCIQRCRSCGSFRWPPRSICASCLSFDHEWLPMSGEGSLYSWTIIARSRLTDFAASVPYVVGVIALDGALVRVIGQVLTGATTKLSPGTRLKVTFDQRVPGRVVPRWELADRGSGVNSR